MRKALQATEAVLAGPFPSLPANRTRFHLCRVRALSALGRAEEAAGELETARARVLRLADGLAPEDRANWLALRVVADTLALTL